MGPAELMIENAIDDTKCHDEVDDNIIKADSIWGVTVTIQVSETSLSNGWATYKVLPLTKDTSGNDIDKIAIESHSGFDPSTGGKGS